MPRTQDLRRKVLTAGAAAFRMSKADIPPAPDSYEPNAYYRIHLSRSIQLPNGTWMRPSDDVAVLGSLAKGIAAYILSAQKVAGP